MQKILKFSAKWCQPCKVLQPEFDKLKDRYSEEIVFEEIDIDVHYNKAAYYNIRSVPTILFIENDIEVKRIAGLTKFNLLQEALIKSFVNS